MTDASFDGTPTWQRAATAPRPLRLPAPQPIGLPVLVHDCITPLGGETLLSLLMKRMADDGDAPGDL